MREGKRERKYERKRERNYESSLKERRVKGSEIE